MAGSILNPQKTFIVVVNFRRSCGGVPLALLNVNNFLPPSNAMKKETTLAVLWAMEFILCYIEQATTFPRLSSLKLMMFLWVSALSNFMPSLTVVGGSFNYEGLTSRETIFENFVKFVEENIPKGGWIYLLLQKHWCCHWELTMVFLITFLWLASVSIFYCCYDSLASPHPVYDSVSQVPSHDIKNLAQFGLGAINQ